MFLPQLEVNVKARRSAGKSLSPYGERRVGGDRRKFTYACHIPERRSREDRRKMVHLKPLEDRAAYGVLERFLTGVHTEIGKLGRDQGVQKN